jgi:soluble cytochrome b562
MFIRSRRTLPVLAAGTILALGALSAAHQPERQPPPPSSPQPVDGQPDRGRQPNGRGGGELTNVDAAMKAMNRAVKRLSSQASDSAKKAENLTIIAEAERACLAAKGLPLPGRVLKKAADDAARDKLAGEFRHNLILVMRKLLDTEQNLAEDKLDAAKANIEELKKLRDAGHEEMGVSDD